MINTGPGKSDSSDWRSAPRWSALSTRKRWTWFAILSVEAGLATGGAAWLLARWFGSPLVAWLAAVVAWAALEAVLISLALRPADSWKLATVWLRRIAIVGTGLWVAFVVALFVSRRP
jgi:hypothetical protein